ncbi:MAG: hypothetical protein LIO96_03910 [Lachnospiraceae bacterium]|nr:hypothetical protein [Lachnospiraceae bacterium]
MSEFTVNITNMKTVSNEFSALNEDLKNICDAILTIQEQTSFESSARDAIIKSLNSLESSILNEAVHSSNLGKALLLIAETYEKTERKILNEAEGTTSRLEQWKDRIESGMLSLLTMLGLDDEYYRWKMGYETYNEEKAQEKLMDEYLQATVLGLLSEDRYSEETWNAASLEERKEILQDFLVEINSIMGTDVDENIIFSTSLSSGTRGYYTYPDNTVTINENLLSASNAGSYAILRTLIHEMRHAYQHAAVDNPENFRVSAETLAQWEANFNDYKSASTDGYEAYVTQAIEYDAKSFAGQDQDIAGYTPTYGGSWE